MRSSVCLAFALALVASSTPAFAIHKTDDMCKQVGEFAETVMKARQGGVAMQKLLDLTASTGESAEARADAKALVLDAYSEPHFATEENKQRAVDDFRDQKLLSCIKNPD